MWCLFLRLPGGDSPVEAYRFPPPDEIALWEQELEGLNDALKVIFAILWKEDPHGAQIGMGIREYALQDGQPFSCVVQAHRVQKVGDYWIPERDFLRPVVGDCAL